MSQLTLAAMSSSINIENEDENQNVPHLSILDGQTRGLALTLQQFRIFQRGLGQPGLSGLRKMSFSKIPPEIRVKIYKMMFTGGQGSIIEPVKKVHCANGAKWVSDAVAFLRVSKDLNVEAASILYGTNTFMFDDSSRGTVGEKVHDCSITSMYAFLRLIGTNNRERIRVLRIEVSKFRFCYYNAETIPGEKVEINGGHFLGDAFELLSRGHGLREIHLQLDNVGIRARLASHMFRSGSMLLEQLEKIKGLNVFDCQWQNPPTQALAIFQSLQTVMTQALPQQPTQQLSAVEMQVKNIGKNVEDLVKRRSELKKRIDEYGTQLVTMKELQARIEEAKKQVQDWQEESKSIDQTLALLQQLSSNVGMQVGLIVIEESSTNPRVETDDNKDNE